jgi:hypothetical protein
MALPLVFVGAGPAKRLSRAWPAPTGAGWAQCAHAMGWFGRDCSHTRGQKNLPTLRLKRKIQTQRTQSTIGSTIKHLCVLQVSVANDFNRLVGWAQGAHAVACYLSLFSSFNRTRKRKSKSVFRRLAFRLTLFAGCVATASA